MRSKEVEEAIDKTKQLQQFIKEKGKDFCFYDNENAVIGYECLKIVLNHIEELEKDNIKWKGKYHLLSRKIDVTPNQVIRDKIEVLARGKNSDWNNEYFIEGRKKEAQIQVLKELLGE